MSAVVLWKSSKYRIDGTRISGTRDVKELAPASRILADLVGSFYTRALPRYVSGDLIDLGCGKAPLLGAYETRCSSIVLADWANSAHENLLLDVVIDLNKPLMALDSSSFDVVLLSDVLEHICEPAALMAEISRILKPGGRLLLNVPFAYWIHEAPHDYYRYTRYALERFARESGLEVLELAPLGGWIEVMADMWAKMLARTKIAILPALIHQVAIRFHRTSVGQRVAARSGEVLPLGYAMVAQKAPTEERL